MKSWFLVALGILIAIPILQNTEVVTIRFYFWEVTMSRVLLFLITLGSGMVLGFAGAKIAARNKRKKAAQGL